MRRICFVSLLLFLLVVPSPLLRADTPSKSAIVYYGADPSWPMLGVHDYIILDPDNVPTDAPGFDSYRERVYAYVSLGESQKDRNYYRRLLKKWKLGKNRTWKSDIMDLSNREYRHFLLVKVIEPLYRRGFRNFFFDTLDSHQLVV